MPATRGPQSTAVLLQHLLIVALTTIFLPATLLALFYNNAALILRPQNTLRRHVQRSPRFKKRKVLVTGVSTPAGLRVARALHYTGHYVVGVEECRYSIFQHARFSNTVSKFYSISLVGGSTNDSRYAENLFRLVVRERAALWIDCSAGIPTPARALAKRLVEERSTCICLMPSRNQIRQLENVHEVQQLAQRLGLPSPETFSVSSRNDIYNVLKDSNGKKYMLRSPNETSHSETQTVIPRRTVSQTYDDVAKMKLSKKTPWTMQQYMEGLAQFTACAVVLRGKLTAFAASSVTEEGDRMAVTSKSGLSEAMKQYMQSFADALGPNFSSHLTMQFCLDERVTHSGVVQQILPLSSHPVSHESLLLFDGKRGSIELSKAYLAALSTTGTELDHHSGLQSGGSDSIGAAHTESNVGVYALVNDLEKLVVGPLIRLLTFRQGISSVARSWITFLHHVVAWKEALYDFRDPLPLFWYVHVSLPSIVFLELLRKAWFQISSVRRTSFRLRHRRKEVQNGTR